MQALIFRGPSTTAEETSIDEVDAPTPGQGELTIDVARAGVNFKDILQRRGDPEWVSRWPLVPGMEVVGTVREVGPGVDTLERGNVVCASAASGGLAEIAKVRADLAVRVPAGVDLGAAAAVPVVLTTSWLLLSRFARILPGETVLVHSAGGGVGTALARLAPGLAPGRMLGTVSDASRVDTVTQAGYDDCFVRDEDLVDRVRGVVPDGVDVILDPMGASAVARDIAMSASGGRIILYGNASGGSHDLPPLYDLLGANVSIGGMSISALAVRAPHVVREAMRQVLAMLQSGGLNYPVTEVPLAEVPEVHEAMSQGRGVGKYVARID